jgi:hypothetical protein
MTKHQRPILTVITAKTGYRVIVGKQEVLHAHAKHFLIPVTMLLELLELVLRDPTVVYADSTSKPREHHIFYKLESGQYLCAVIKITDTGAFFASMYSTGSSIRKIHKGMKKLQI